MITGEQVKAAMMAAGIERVDHHACAGCGEMVIYSRGGDELFFEPACGCSYSDPEPRTWQSAADWINMQTREDIRAKLMQKFGIDPTASD